MTSLFTSRRKPKRVGREGGSSEPDENEPDSGPVVRRPNTSAPKTKSKLRLSFNPSENDVYQTEEHFVSISTPRSTLKAPGPAHSIAAQKAAKELWTAGLQDRPTYSKDYLNELRNSTPSTPKDNSAYNSSAEDDGDAVVLDVASKFGKSKLASSSIPSAAEIEEKKQRRARLAKEQTGDEYIALEDYDSDGEFKPQRMQISTLLRDDVDKDTRLVRDDEDFAEGFDDFVEDSGKVSLSKKGRREQVRKEREALRDLIAEAEDSSGEDDSDAERNAAYELAQTSHGMDGLSAPKASAGIKPKAPKEITPIPKLSAVLGRLRNGIQELEYEKASLQKRRADLQKEKVEIAARGENIQRLLIEAGDEFERIKTDSNHSKGGSLNGISDGSGNRVERGLESLGGTPGP